MILEVGCGVITVCKLFILAVCQGGGACYHSLALSFHLVHIIGKIICTTHISAVAQLNNISNRTLANFLCV